ncbi:MAG TPA: tripartite tricarboxylate transporter substrate binding protein, partial [Burkholderiales bacterium]|nr:tripartite tricarboxylate transporter substrate binding protein [Burkholderiales bacterium]
MASKLNLKHALLALAAAWAVIPTAHAASGDVDKYPTKPVRLIGPFVPGGGTDITARAIAAKLTERWGQQVIVDNRPGAAGTIGVELTATAIPDGYTICLISASHSVNSATNPKLPYDLTKDLQAVSQATSLFYVMYVHPSVPAKSVQELISYAKTNPAKLSFGSSGTGGLQHLAGEMFNHLAGTKMVHVPYKGGAAATADVLAGNIQVGFGTLLSSRAHYKSGKLRGLAITARQRTPTAPEYPTIAEAGLPGFEVNNCYGILVPAKTPRAIVNKLNGDIVRILRVP